MVLKETLSKIFPVKKEFYEIAQKRLDSLTKPKGSLGRLEEFAKRLVAIYEKEMPKIEKKVIFTFAADHGVVEEGVSAFPSEVTRQMVYNFINGGAGINVLARHAKADVVVVDVGVNYDFEELEGLLKRKVIYGSNNIVKGPAMSVDEAKKCIEVGIEIAHLYVNKGYKMVATGEMGIGNTTPSSAIAAVLTKHPVSEVTGRGTGITDKALRKKIEVIKKAIDINKPNASDPIDVLAKVGGAEIGAIAGLCLGAAEKKVPVVIDGFISTAGSLIAYELNKTVADYMFAAHRSMEQGHQLMLKHIGLNPILDLELRLGEGTGAALAMILIEAGLKIYREMATFQEAEVSKEIEI